MMAEGLTQRHPSKDAKQKGRKRCWMRLRRVHTD